MESTEKCTGDNEKTPLLKTMKQNSHGSSFYVVDDREIQHDERNQEVIEENYSTNATLNFGFKHKLSVVCILLTEMCERMTYYSISANMVIFCTNVLLYTSIQAVTISLTFTGACFILPVVGGWLADSVSGRFNTIFGGGLIYIVGSLLLFPVALDYGQFQDPSIGMTLTLKRVFFMIAIIFVAAGTSGLKSNVSPFGAQQVEHMGNDMIQTFFLWFYWFVNLGGVIAFTGLVYIQQEISFALGYFITAVSMILSVIFFTIPRNFYKKTLPPGSVVSRFCKIIYTAIKEKSRSKNKFPWFLDHASDKYGGQFPEVEVEGIRSQIRMLPVFLSAIMYSVTYTQLSSTFILQGERLNLQVGNFTVPVASLSMFNTIMIMFLIPLVDMVIFPLLAKCRMKPSQLQRIGFGFFLGAVSMAFAGGLEIARRNDIAQNGGFPQEVAGVVYNASHLSVFYQIPQYVFSGTGEIFAAIAGLEFAYSQAPKMMQGITMGFYLVTLGAGALLGTALLNIVNFATAPDEWLPDDINNGYLEKYYFLLSGLTLCVVVIFGIYAKWFYTYASYSIDYTVTAGDAKFGTLESEKGALILSSEYETDTTGGTEKKLDKTKENVPK